MDAGIFVDRTADRARRRGQRARGQSDRRSISGARTTRWCARNRIEGMRDTAPDGAGTGDFDLEHAGLAGRGQRRQLGPRRRVLGVEQRTTSSAATSFRELRFAVHYMYTNDSEVAGNIVGRQRRRLRHDVFGPAAPARQRVATTTATTACCSTYANSGADRGQRRARQREMRVHLQCEQEPFRGQLVRGLPASASISPPAPSAT